MKPLILLTGGTGAAANGTPTWALNQNYAENIRRAGGIPILAVNNDCAEEYADPVSYTHLTLPTSGLV